MARVEISMLQPRETDNCSKSSFSLKVLSAWDKARQEGLLQSSPGTRCHFVPVKTENHKAANFASICFPFYCTDRLGVWGEKNRLIPWI